MLHYRNLKENKISIFLFTSWNVFLVCAGILIGQKTIQEPEKKCRLVPDSYSGLFEFLNEEDNTK